MNYTGVLTEELSHYKKSVYHLRYEVLVKEQGKHPVYANHLSGSIQEPLDENGLLFAKITGGVVVGAARLNGFRDIHDPFYLECYGIDLFRENDLLEEVVIISRMLMLPAFRGSASFAGFAKEIYRWVLSSGRSLLLIECTPAFAVAFSKMGFRPYREAMLHPDGMMVRPMLLDCNNREWLRQVGSVLDRVYPVGFTGKPELSAIISSMEGFSSCV
ncbi:MAG: hypothetical protein J7578_05435 [Chitinophagaceae bacterium]|nr:hypothetical protein [Chitinophagaceae bacterium]